MVLESVGSLAGVGIALASKNLIDAAVGGDTRSLFPWGGAFAAVILLNLVVEAWSNLLGVRVNQGLNNHLREGVFSEVSRSEWLDVSKYHSGDLLTRLTEDVEGVADAYTGLVPSMVSLAVGFVAAFGVLYAFDPILAMMAFALSPLALLLSRWFASKGKRLYLGVQSSESATRSYIQESLQNLLIMKTFQMEASSIAHLQGLHQERLSRHLARNRYGVLAGTVMSSAYWVGYFVAFAWGAWRLAVKEISFGTVAAFLQLVEQIQSPIIAMAYSVPQMVAAVGSMERLAELELMNREEAADMVSEASEAGFVFQDVDYAYEVNMPVLTKASIEVKAGETVALMGPSGEGKTTLIRLMLALIKPDHGEVFFVTHGGQRCKAHAGTRSLLAYVPQGNTLFSGTLADNLKTAQGDVSREAMESACLAADLKDFLDTLPEGLDTLVGEDGLGISEGQAQRIAIARALLRDAPILILDEATSALDMETEARILKGIKALPARKTCLMVTHRPSSLEICSRVLRLKNGGIQEDNQREIN